MKRSFIPAVALMLSLATVFAFSGCEGVSPVDTAELNAGRSAAAESAAVTVTGLVVAIDGKTAVAWEGIPYYVNGVDLTEGKTVTVSGETVPVIGWDEEGNSLFYGYSVKAGKVTGNS